ncbi:MAG: oligosaccharide flippase family protein [Microscillaceae bacterium]|nr:oligosaccharide flippase family protein [Microscillaceae bacterium]
MYKNLVGVFTENKGIINNFIALGLIQGTNFILPLITIPYLVRILGTDKYGLINLAQAFMIYFIIFTDYGFHISATRKISLHRSDQAQLSKIISEVFSIKLFLGFISFLLVLLIVENVDKFKGNQSLFYLSFGLVLGNILFPTWFFQGVEEMKYLTYLNLVAKIFFTIMIFILIKEAAHFKYVLLIQALGNIISGLIGLWLMLYKYRVTFIFPGVGQVLEELKQGWFIFISNFSMSIFMYVNIFILAFFASEQVVGYYSVPEKIMIMLWQIPIIFSQAIYPQLCILSQKSFESIVFFFRRLYLAFASLIFLLCLGMYLFADYIIYFITGEFSQTMVMLHRMLCFVPFIVTLNVPAYQTLMVYGLTKSYLLILTSASLLNILLNIVLTYFYQAWGTTLAILIIQSLITISLYLIIEWRHPQYSFLTYFRKY